MLVTLFGTVMLVKLLQLLNALSSIFVRPSGNDTPFRPPHPSKALLPMLVTVLGITTFSILLAFSHTYAGILVIPSANSTSVSTPSPAKAPLSPPYSQPLVITVLGILIFSIYVSAIILYPNFFTPSGIVSSSRALQSPNAQSPMLVTFPGIVTSVRLVHPLKA